MFPTTTVDVPGSITTGPVRSKASRIDPLQPREPDNSESGTNPGRQKRGRKSNLMKQRRFFWYKWYKNWFKCIFKNQIRLSTVDNFRAKTSLFPTYQDLAESGGLRWRRNIILGEDAVTTTPQSEFRSLAYL